jgi:hypothetical protein
MEICKNIRNDSPMPVRNNFFNILTLGGGDERFKRAMRNKSKFAFRSLICCKNVNQNMM